MAASRASSIRILRAVLAEARPAVPTKRALHITGARNSPAFSPTGAKESIASLQRRSLTDLKDECMKRTISSSGTKHELIERLANHDALQSRAFSIAMKRIVKEDKRGPLGGTSSVEQSPSRHFNTTRAMKAPHDSSPIDLAYLPDLSALSLDSTAQAIRVPIVPDGFNLHSPASETIVHSESTPIDEVGMRPEIYTVSDPEGIHGVTTKVSSLQDVVDNSALEIDPYNLTETVSKAARKISSRVETEVDGTTSGLKRVWSGLVDDILGEKKVAH